jgi:hypothetical protein
MPHARYCSAPEVPAPTALLTFDCGVLLLDFILLCENQSVGGSVQIVTAGHMHACGGTVCLCGAHRRLINNTNGGQLMRRLLSSVLVHTV